jgi:hypothetical protein
VSARRTVAVLVTAFLATGTSAEEVPSSLVVNLEARAGHLLASMDLTPAYRPELRRQLSNGLTNVIALHFSVLPEHGEEPIAFFAREIDVLYDVWEESYGVIVKDAQSPRGRHLTFSTWEALRGFLVVVKELDLASLGILGTDRWVLVTRIEVNPVSQELLDRTREWMANPAAGSRTPGTNSRSMIGAMASYLLRRTDASGDVHLFRSPPFSVRDGAIR